MLPTRRGSNPQTPDHQSDSPLSQVSNHREILAQRYVDNELAALCKNVFEIFVASGSPDKPVHPHSLITTFAVRFENH